MSNDLLIFAAAVLSLYTATRVYRANLVQKRKALLRIKALRLQDDTLAVLEHMVEQEAERAALLARVGKGPKNP